MRLAILVAITACHTPEPVGPPVPAAPSLDLVAPVTATGREAPIGLDWGPEGHKPAAQLFKNVTVLGGLTGDRVMAAMQSMQSSTGLDCNGCHDVAAKDFAADSVPAKARTRIMIRMTEQLDRQVFGGTTRVTCWTCHRGAAKPRPRPFATDLPAPFATMPADELARPAEQVLHDVDKLKGTTVRQFGLIMKWFTTELGVPCKHCHQADYAAPTAMKRRAREMLDMVTAIGKDFYAGNTPIECGTCHAGSARPPRTPGPMDALPASLVDYMQQRGWGGMHLEWHSVRRWDLLPPAAVAYAERQGWSRAPRQEGEAGNGVEFLAMHRAMLQVLVEQAPDARAYFTGWAAPPTDPHDARDPLPHGAMTAFDPDMRAALDRVEHHLDQFASEDELGLYLETAMRPTAGHPEARAADRTAGVHNYLHNRFQDPASPIDMGNPQVNLLNPRFWRLHGWIDHVWTAYRTQAHLSDDDPAYRKAMDVARGAMTMKMKGTRNAEPPPQALIDAVRP